MPKKKKIVYQKCNCMCHSFQKSPYYSDRCYAWCEHCGKEPEWAKKKKGLWERIEELLRVQVGDILEDEIVREWVADCLFVLFRKKFSELIGEDEKPEVVAGVCQGCQEVESCCDCDYLARNQLRAELREKVKNDTHN